MVSSSRSRIALVAAALALLAAFGIWLLQREPAPEERELPAPAAESAAADPLVAPAEAGSEVARQAEVAELVPEVTRAPVAEVPALARVRGRCVSTEERSPIAGAVAKLDGSGANERREALQGKVSWNDPEPVVSDTQGRFEIAFDPPSGYQFGFEVEASGRVKRTARWGRIESGQVVDLGDIELARGYEVRGRVVDEGGQPVKGIVVMLGNLPFPLATNMSASDGSHGESDERGEFRIGSAIPAGTWPLAASGEEMTLVAPDRVTVIQQVGAPELVVTMRPMKALSGIVVDDLGAPVEGVDINAVSSRDGSRPGTRTRKDGSFRIMTRERDPAPTRLVIDDAKRCLRPDPPDPTEYAWGTSGIRIVLTRAPQVELLVVERGSGEPITRYAVQHGPASSTSLNESEWRLRGTHEGGRVRIEGVPLGAYAVIVMPMDPWFAPGPKLRFEVGDAPVHPLRVELERLSEQVVRVVDASDRPVSGARVEVIEKGHHDLQLDSPLWNRRFDGPQLMVEDEPQLRPAELLSRADTDAAGLAKVYVPSGERELALRVLAAEHRPLLRFPAQFPAGGGELRIALASAAAIAGRVALSGLRSEQLELQWVRPPDPGERWPSRGETELAADGSFALRGLVPGVYRFELRYRWMYQKPNGGGSGSASRLPLEIPEVTATAGETSELAIDATRFAPAHLRGRLLLDGEPPSNAVLALSSSSARHGAFTPAADGSYVARELLPGKLIAQLVLASGSSGAEVALFGEEELELAPGEERVADLRFVRRRLELELLDRDGATALAKAEIWWSHTRGNGSAQADERGVVVLDPALVGPIRIFSSEGEGAARRSVEWGTVELPASAKVHRAQIRRP